MFYHGDINDRYEYEMYLAQVEAEEEELKARFEEHVYGMTLQLQEETNFDVKIIERTLAECNYDFHSARQVLLSKLSELAYDSFRESVYNQFKELKSSTYNDDFETFLANDYQNTELMEAFLSDIDFDFYLEDSLLLVSDLEGLFSTDTDFIDKNVGVKDIQKKEINYNDYDFMKIPEEVDDDYIPFF